MPRGDDWTATRCCYRPLSGDRYRFIWETTRACNLSCKHCFVGRSSEDGLTTAECLRVCADLSNWPVGKVMITGGEPFVRNDLVEILRAIRAATDGVTVDVTTNLTVPNADTLRLIARERLIDECTTSIDGSPDIHDHIRGCRGALDRTLKNVKVLCRSGVSVDVVMVVQSENLAHIADTARIAEAVGARSITLSGVILTKPGSDSTSLRSLRPAVSDNEIESLSAVLRTTVGIPFRFVNLGERISSGGPCDGKRVVSMDFRGDVRKCLLVDQPDGGDGRRGAFEMPSQRYRDLNQPFCTLR